MFDAKRFGEALSVEEASKRIQNAVPKTTQYKTMWGIRVFQSWKNERANDNGSAEFCKFGLDVSAVQKPEDRHVKCDCQNVEFLVVQVCTRSVG